MDCKAEAEPEVGLHKYMGNDVWQKYIPQETPLTQKVVLYVHGWKPNTRRPFDRFVTPKDLYGTETDTLQPWLAEGYTALAFEWRAYADEALVTDAERKIWDAEATGRWRKVDGEYVTGPPRARDLGTALFDAYMQVYAWQLQTFGASEDCYFHVVGHSLGCQMVTRLLYLILESQTPERVARLLPQRVTLLDPYFTNFRKPYLRGRWTGEVVRQAIAQCQEAHGLAVEQYKSSAVLDNPVSDSNQQLRLFTAYFVLYPQFIPLAWGTKDVAVLSQRHSCCRFLYFWSKAYAAPAEQLRQAGALRPTGDVAGYANMPDAQVRRLAGLACEWVQCSGLQSADPQDHRFERQPATWAARVARAGRTPSPPQPVEEPAVA